MSVSSTWACLKWLTLKKLPKETKFREGNTPTIDPAYDDAFYDSDDENTEAGAVVVHQLQDIHASLEYTQIILNWIAVCSVLIIIFDNIIVSCQYIFIPSQGTDDWLKCE